MFICKKTGRQFEKFRSLMIHIRNQYDNLLEAYLNEKEIKEIPKCPFCEKGRKFKSFNIGFQLTCGGNECIQKLYEQVNKQLGDNRKLKYKDGYDEFIKQNIDFYKLHLHEKGIEDPFFKKKSNRYLASVMAANIKNKDIYNNKFWFEKRICECCKEEYEISTFSDRLRCSEYCYRIKGTELPKKFVNGFYIKDNYTIPKKEDLVVGYWYDSFFQLYVPIRKHSLGFENYYFKQQNIDLLSYYNHHNLMQECIICSKFYLRFRPNVLDNELNFVKIKKQLNHCTSRKCYTECVKNRLFENMFSEETGNKISASLRKRVSEGYTPKATNSWCHTRIEFDGHLFRSSWELAFWLINKNPFLEFETIRIPYFFENKIKNYIVDFVDTKNNIIYEIKPLECRNTDQIVAKINSAKTWCLDNNYFYVIIGIEYFVKYKQFLENYLYAFPDLKKILSSVKKYEQKFCKN